MALLIIIKSILAAVIVICNVTILGVLFTNKEMRNTSTIFRMSLAFADLLVGVVVFPSTAANLDYYFTRTLTFDESLKTNGYLINNHTNFSHPTFDGSSKICTHDSFSSPLVNAAGFFSTVSTTVSVFSLVAAAIDRFVAVYRPLQHFQVISFLVPRTSVACIWLLGVFIASLPYFSLALPYSVIFSVAVVPYGFFGTALYGILTITALVIMWVVTFATYSVYRNYLKRNAHLRTSIRDKTEDLRSKNLILILGIMVTAFTVSVLPTAILMIYEATLLNAKSFNLKNELAYYDIGVVVVMLFLSNSLWNFFIYSARDSAFRKASKNMYVQLFGKCWPRK